jgi:Uma2 family endonuclease
MSRLVAYWLGHYQRFTPGVLGEDHASIFLDDLGEPQPDAVLRYPEEFQGKTRIVDGFIHGAPEFVLEIARTSRQIDLVKKKQDYERAGVPEYVVIALDPDQVDWHLLRADRLIQASPDSEGVFRSDTFPGLWLDPAALYAEDWNRLIETLDRGLRSSEHQEFVERLEGARGQA